MIDPLYMGYREFPVVKTVVCPLCGLMLYSDITKRLYRHGHSEYCPHSDRNYEMETVVLREAGR